MKSKKILFATFFVALLMLLTPCISALNVSINETKEFSTQIDDKIDKDIEQTLDSDKIDEIIEENELNNLIDLDINLRHILFRLVCFVIWVILVFMNVLLIVNPVFWTPFLFTSIIMALGGFALGIKDGTGDSIERAVAGFLLGLLTVPFITSLYFHLWTDGRFIPEGGSLFDAPITALAMNLMNMFYGNNPITALVQ